MAFSTRSNQNVQKVKTNTTHAVTQVRVNDVLSQATCQPNPQNHYYHQHNAFDYQSQIKILKPSTQAPNTYQFKFTKQYLLHKQYAITVYPQSVLWLDTRNGDIF